MSAETAKLLHFFHDSSRIPPLNPAEPTGKVLQFPDKKLKEQGEIIRRQIDRFRLYGFDIELGLTGEEYIASFPNPLPQPEEYKNVFDTLLVVDPRIPVKRQAQLVNIRFDIENLGNDKIVDVTPVPSRPYAVWTHGGKKYFGLKVKDAIEGFKEMEVGSPTIELLTLYIQFPERLYSPSHGLVAGGTFIDNDHVPILENLGGVRIGKLWTLRKHNDILTRGKEINVAA